MKERHDIRDIEISNKELLNIITKKHDLNTDAIDNINTKTKNMSDLSTKVSSLPTISNKRNLEESFSNAFKNKTVENKIKFDFMNDKREYPPRMIPFGLKTDRGNSVIMTKKMYENKYILNKINTVPNNAMSPNSSITNVTQNKINSGKIKSLKHPNNLISNQSNIKSTKIKSKYDNEESKNTKNLTGAVLQELSIQYDMSRREI